MKFFINFFLLITIACYSFLDAILDGRVTPIILQSTYTFTDYEWTKGRVTFLNGFDLPPNGTVIFDSCGSVFGNVNFNNSTLVLNNMMYMGADSLLRGTGFLNFNKNTILIDTDMILENSSFFYILSDGAFRGKKNNQLRLGSCYIVFTDNVQSFTFSNIVVREPYNMITKSTSPARFCLNNVKFVFYNKCTLFSDTVFIKNLVDVQPFSGTKTLVINNNLMLSPGATLTLRSKASLSINKIYSDDQSSSIIMDTGVLTFISTSTGLFVFQNFYRNNAPGTGQLIVRGQSQLKTSSATLNLMFPPKSRLILDSGAQLKLTTKGGLKFF